MKNWLEPEPVSVPENLREMVGGNALVSEVLVRRGFSSLDRAAGFLDPRSYTPASPYELPGMESGVSRLLSAIQAHESILVWGDFDVDGQTASTLLVSTLRDLGGEVHFHIPLREVESHGVNLPVLDQEIRQGVDLLLTCDTGISARDAVAFANSRGVDVIISDHHDPPARLPEALALINPKLCEEDYPLLTLPGVGVAYKLAEALYQEAGRAGEVEAHLDLVALGIVADLALQVKDTRNLLQRGLAALRGTQRLGLQRIFALAEIDPGGLNEEHIGYEIAPRLNALGRLADANSAVELLTTRDDGRAEMLATQLEGLNELRKLETRQVFQAAQAQIENDPSLLEGDVLVLSHPAWPGGVIGIVASRLVERYARPALLITAPAGEVGRGSARSIPGVDISAAIAAHQDLLESFGGHPMAAGFAIKQENIPSFRQALSATVGEMMAAEKFEPLLDIDGYMPLSELSVELVSDLERLAPFGPGNPNLVLVSRDLHLEKHRALGREEEHLLMHLTNEQAGEFKVIWWGGGMEQLPQWMTAGLPFDLAYSARGRDFRGEKEVQVEWIAARPVEAEILQLIAKPKRIEVHDYRGQAGPLEILKQIFDPRDMLIWAEAGAGKKLAEMDFPSVDRYSLSAAKGLVIWTSPPGGEELRAALMTVEPEAVYLLAVDPEMDSQNKFLERLAGLLKYALRRKGGQVSLPELAAGTAHNEATVRLGVDLLVQRGDIRVLAADGDQLLLEGGDGEMNPGLDALSDRLGALLEETAAFRAYYSRVDASQLIKPESEA